MNSEPNLHPPDGPSRRERGRPPRRAWPRRLIFLGLAVLALGAAGPGAVGLWVRSYLKSPGFTGQVAAAAGRVLEADCRLDEVTWQGESAYAGTFTADGQKGAVFRHLALADVRVQMDTGALWDQAWRVEKIRIASADLDFSAGGRLPEAAPESGTTAAPPAAPAPAWLRRWLPNRTIPGPVQVDRFDFTKAGDLRFPEMSGRGFSLDLRPSLRPARVEVEGRAGELRLAGMAQPLAVSRLRGILRPEDAAVTQFEGTVAGAGVTAEGTAAFGTPGDLRLKLTVSDASLEPWLPEDWLKRCSGTASLRAGVKGDWRRPEQLQVEGDFRIRDAIVQALPMLDIIAKKTRNASFLRMQIKEATGTLTRRGAEHWEVRTLRADAPGLLRLKGRVVIGTGGSLAGSLLLGIVPGTLRYLAGAEQTVFLTPEKFSALTENAGSLASDDAGLLWTRFTLSGTAAAPVEDLSGRLARAWFNATVEQVMALSMESAAALARSASGAAGVVLEAAPPLLEKAPELLNQGVDTGLKLLETLVPR